MDWYLGVWKKYAVFSGRARRKEYFMFYLFTLIVYFVLSFLGQLLSENSPQILVGVYQLAALVPSIAVAVRRMHDTDHSGWWVLVPIANIIFVFTEGTKGDNKYGPDPKAIPQTTPSIT